MKRRNIWKKEEAVSPVIATILMVAITVVLAATLYMMLPGADEGEGTAAMSGRKTKVNDGWIIHIDGGNVAFNNGRDLQLYNINTGASDSAEANFAGTPPTGTINSYNITFNDNDGNDRINGGDTFKIVDMNHDLEDVYDFRVAGTNLAVEL